VASLATSSKLFIDPDVPNEKSFIKKNTPSNKLTRWTVQLQSFAEFCKVDLDLMPKMAKSHIARVRKVFNAAGSDRTTESIRKYLGSLENSSTYNNHLKALRAYFRDFKGDDSIIKTFR
jgi:hypothetical protein